MAVRWRQLGRHQRFLENTSATRPPTARTGQTCLTPKLDPLLGLHFGNVLGDALCAQRRPASPIRRAHAQAGPQRSFQGPSPPHAWTCRQPARSWSDSIRCRRGARSDDRARPRSSSLAQQAAEGGPEVAGIRRPHPRRVDSCVKRRSPRSLPPARQAGSGQHCPSGLTAPTKSDRAAARCRDKPVHRTR